MIEDIIFYDTDFLLNFLLIDEISFLRKFFKKIILPEFVFNELSFKETITKETVIQLKNKGFIEVAKIDIFSEDYTTFKCIKKGYWHDFNKQIGKGESSAIALAINKKGILASNNLADIKFYVDKYNIPLLTVSYFIALLVENKKISCEEANELWEKMINKKRKMPCKTFFEYYNSVYPKDKKDFGYKLKKVTL